LTVGQAANGHISSLMVLGHFAMVFKSIVLACIPFCYGTPTAQCVSFCCCLAHEPSEDFAPYYFSFDLIM